MQLWLWLIIACFGQGFIMSRVITSESDSILPVFVFIAVIIITIFINVSINRKREDKANGILFRVKGKHIHGLPLQTGLLVEVTLESGFVLFNAPGLSARINLNQIRVAAAMSQSDFAKKQKSVIGRAVVGGILIGPVGAVVGGMSGIGDKDMKGGFLVINYINEVGELAAVVINVFVLASAVQVAQQLNHTANIGTVNL